MTADLDSARRLVAWLLWCIDEGYTNPADRDILDNWMGDDEDTLTDSDVQDRAHLLLMADEIIAEAAPAICRATASTHVAQLAREWEQENWPLQPPPAYFARALREAIDADNLAALERTTDCRGRL